jgi:hypothetical protein
MIKCYSTCNYFHLMTVVFQNDFPKMHSVNRSLINDLHQPYFVHVSKKNSTGKGKATLTDIAWSRHSRRTQATDGLRSYGTNRSRSKKTPNSGLPSLTGRLQLSTPQQPKPEGGTQETEPESRRGTVRGFF